MAMTTPQLRENIRSALNDYQQHEAWSRWLLARSRDLHRGVMLPEGYRASTLINFTRNYLMQLPALLEHAEQTAERLSLLPCTTLLDIAMDYLCSAQTRLPDEGGLIYDWLVRAYVGHRLLEEMQDWVSSNHGENLIHLDNTRANLLAHELLGDSFCTKLEENIQNLCAVLHLEETHTLHQRRAHYHQPPCMLANAMATLWLQEPLPA